MTQTDWLSAKPIPPADRLILALDVPNADEARALVERLGDSVHFYKVGLELFASGGYFELIDWLVARGKKVFADLKLYDVPETVRSAVRQLARRPITFTTVHGNDGILEAAAGEKRDLKILAVTVLTSLDQQDLRDMGISVEVGELVLARARRAQELGCDGIISSGLEALAVREALGEKLIVVTPGIRPAENRPSDDQKRVTTPSEAFRNGADYIVVGRPIRNAPDPKAAAEAVQAEIRALFGASAGKPLGSRLAARFADIGFAGEVAEAGGAGPDSAELEETLMAISRRSSALPDLDPREADEILGYDDKGTILPD